MSGFRNCLAKYTVHSLSPCYGSLTAVVLLNSVARWCSTTKFLQKWCNLYACLHGRRKDFIQWILSKVFQWGAKSCEIWFLPLTTKKTAFFAEIFKFLSPSDTHVCVQENVRATPLNNWCNFKRFNAILNSEILLNLLRKMKCLTDQFQLFCCFCIGNTKQLYLFLHWQQNWHSYRQLDSCYTCFLLFLHSGI